MNQKQLALMKGDFRNFLWYVWKHLGLPEPTPIQYEIAYYLQHGPRRKMIQAFRGVGKSFITSAYVLWSLWNDPDKKFLVVSAASDRAISFSTFVKRLIHEIPFLSHLKADPDKGQRDSVIAFDVGPAKPSQFPSVKSVGIFGQLTGFRAHEIVADDVEVASNSMTQDMRDKLLARALEFEALILPDVGKITYLGTPQTEESIYNKLRERGYKAKIWPVRYPAPDRVHIYNGDLAESIIERLENDPDCVGKSTEPARFNDLELAEREAAWGRSGFNLQFMLDTTLSDAERYPLKLSDLIIMSTDVEKAPISVTWASNPELQIKELPNVGFTGDRFYRPWRVDPNWTPYEGAVLAIDPSGRGKDEMGYAVVKMLHGYLYVTDFGGLKGGYDDLNLIKLAKIAKEQKVNYVIVESNFGDGMFTKLFEPILARYYPCQIDEVRHSQQKEKRIIDTLEPVMNRHKIIIDFEAAKKDILETQEEPQYSLFYQMTRITRERGSLKHDDRLDVLAIAVAFWVEYMNRDEQKAEQSWHERRLQEELEVFMKHALGPKKLDSNDLRVSFMRR